MTIIVYLWIIGVTVATREPFLLVGLITLPMAMKAIRGSFKATDMSRFVPAMANNVMVVLLTQLLLGIGYILARVF